MRRLGATIAPIELPQERGPRGALCLLTDITEVTELREQVALKNNLESLGEMSAGLAHEFKNAIATLQGYAQLLQSLELNDKAQVAAGSLLNEVRNLSSMVTAFLNFARPQPLQLEDVSVAELIRDCAEELQMELEVDADDSIVIRADERMLRLALLNLIRNAVEAAPGGRVFVRARESTIEVRDTGKGIPTADLQKIFIPFFTTKAKGHGIGLALTHRVIAQPATLTKKQSDALDSYTKAVKNFELVLSQRRAQIDSRQPLPNLPGQALYLARNNMLGAARDLTDALPSKIGRPNKFGIPPAYFDADNEPLLDEYVRLFALMQAPPADAQKSGTPFKDVVDLGIAIARAKGLDGADADAAGRISLGLFFAETNGNQNIGNARSNKYKGSFQTGISEDQNGRKKWAAVRNKVAAFDSALILRDDREEVRAGRLDRRYNHWTAVRDALMNAHADLFPQVPAIVKTLPDPIDQMKLFELIQIVPAPTRSALASGDLLNYRVSDPTIMRYLRNNSMFAFGQAERARTSATYRQILDAMWLFNPKFEQALARFNEAKAR